MVTCWRAWAAAGVCGLGWTGANAQDEPAWWRPVQVDTHFTAGVGLDGDDSDLSELTVIPKWEQRWDNGVRFTGSLRLRLDGSDDLTPGRPNLAGYSPASRPFELDDDGELEVREAYLDFDLGPADVRLGKQQIVWGKLYGFKLLDAVNPQSFREFILEDFDQSRIGLWSASVEAPLPEGPLGSWELQAVWAPDPSVHRIPEAGATFEFQAPRFRFGEQPGEPSPPTVTERPDDPLGDAVYAARLAGFVGGVDLAFVAISGPDPQPLGRVELRDDEPVVVRFHERRTLVGASAATSFGRVTTRLEVGYTPNRQIVTRSDAGALGQAEVDQLGVAVAADISGPFATTLSAQIFSDQILDAPAADIVRPDHDTLLSVVARRRFLDDTLTTELGWYASQSGGDSVWRPKVSYAVSDALSVSVAADIFSGDVDGIFGQFAERDRILVSVRRVF